MKKAFVGVGMVALLLTGCAGEVSISDADSVRVAQYAADLMLKYDVNFKERLLTAEEEKVEEEKLRLAAEKEQKLQELLAREENANNAEKDKTDKTDKKDEDNPQGTGESAETITRYDINDVLKYDGFKFARGDYQLVNEYGNDTEDTGMSVDVQAPAGKKLLVTKYTITNVSNTALECDLFSKDISASVQINGDMKGTSMVTMLLDDLGTYKAQIEAGASKEAVLIFEVPDSVTQVQQLDLTLQVGEQSFLLQ